MVGDQTQKKKNSHSDQKNPYDLMLQLFFDGILYHGFSSLKISPLMGEDIKELSLFRDQIKILRNRLPDLLH